MAEETCKWAERCRMLTRGKPIVQGGDTVDERVHRLIDVAATRMTGLIGTLAQAKLIVDLFERLDNDGLLDDEDQPLAEVVFQLSQFVGEREEVTDA